MLTRHTDEISWVTSFMNVADINIIIMDFSILDALMGAASKAEAEQTPLPPPPQTLVPLLAPLPTPPHNQDEKFMHDLMA